MTEDELTARRKARATLSQAGAEYADAFEATAGAIVTGCVPVFEMTTAEGRYCLWLTGTGGEPTAEHTEGLDSWRIEGMVRKVLRDIHDANVSTE